MAAVAAVVYATLGTATIGAAAQATEESGKTLHVYILTGQSNSLGAVKGDPASAETLAYYSTKDKNGDADGILMWDGNMAGSLSDPTSGGIAWSNEGKTWMTVQPQQTPTSNGCHGAAGTPYENLTGQTDLRSAWEAGYGYGVMGPEYGFSYMTQKKGWKLNATDDVAIIKVSRDGGNNDNWVKPASGVNGYTFLLHSVITALKNIDTDAYSSVQLDGLMYLQGETGNATNAGKAKTVMQDLIANLKTDIAAAMVSDADLAAKAGKITVSLGDLVLGEPATWGTNDPGSCPTLTGQAFLAWANESDSVGFVHTRDLTKITPGDGYNVHYDGNSEITIGARYAYTMAATQGMDTTEGGTVRVRSQQFGDTDMDASLAPVSLNDSRAWWQSSGDAVQYSAASMANTVAVWDVSSANMGGTTQGAETLSADLSVKGIRIEDPYADDDTTGTHNATITIRNAEGADATLTVGSAGIELQRGNLNLQTKVATNGAQTWTVAGGKTLTVANSIGGTDTVSLHKHAEITSAAAAQFDFSAAMDAGHRTWNIGNGVKVALSDTGFAQSTLAVEAAASAALAGGNVSLGTLTLGNGAALDLAGGLTLSAGTVNVADTAALTFNYSNGSFSALNAGTVSAGENSAITINLGHVASLSRAEFTLGTGWSGWSVSDEAGSGKVLSLGSDVPYGYHLTVDGAGNLILSGVPTYPDVQKTWVTTPAGATVAAAANLVAANSAQFVAGSDSVKAVLVNGAGGNSMLLYGAQKTSMGEGKALYTEMQVTNAQFISNVGTFSQGDYDNTTVTGDYNMKIADGTTIQSVFGASNIKVDGSVYTELSAADASYTGTKYGVVAAFGANVSGDVSLVINGGTFNSNVNVYGTMVNAGHCGTLSIEVNGGSLQNIYVSDANAHTINAAQVILNGGTVNGSVYGSNTNVNITNGTSVFIGGDAIVKGDVFGGINASTLTGRVTLHDMAENAKFLTNFAAEKGIYADNIVLNDTTIGSGFNGTLHANTVTINEGSSLVAGKLAEGAALAGSGDYKLAAGTQAMTSGVTLSDDWTGAVVISGNLNDLNLNKSNTTAQGLYKEGSVIRLDGWTGYFANASQQIEANIEIGKGGASITNGWGANVQTFSGKLSGEGNITRTNASNMTPQLKFTGDVSEYTGSFVNTRTNDSYGIKLTFSDAADTINASFKNDKGAAGTLELHMAAASTTLNGSIVRDSNYAQNKLTLTMDDTASSLTINNAAELTSLAAAGKAISLGSHGEGDSTTHGALKVTGEANIGSLNLGSGTSATFNGTTTISGALTNSGLLTVNDTLNLTGGRGTAWELGSVAGEGTIVASSANGNRVYNISGDLTNWTGAFKQATGSGNMTLNITGTSVLNADIINQTTAAACTLDVKLLHDMTVNSTMSAEGAGPVNVTVGDATHVVSVLFNQTLNVNSLSTGSGSTFTFGEGASFTGNTVSAYKGGQLTVEGDMGTAENALTKLAVGSGGSLTVDEGAEIYTSQLIMSDDNGVGNTTINGGAVHITGTDNTHNTSASLLLAHWGHNSTLTLNGGELDAENTLARLSWTGTGTLSVQGGTAKLLGIANWAQYGEKGKVLLGAADSGNGVIELGAQGISDATTSANVQIQFGRGTLKAAADTVVGWNASNMGTASTNGTTISLIAAGDGATTLDSNGHTLGIGNKMEGSGNVAKVGEGSLSLTGHLKTTGAVTIEEGTIDLKTAGASSGRLTFTNAADISLAKKDGAEKATLSNVLLEAEGSKGISAAASGSKAAVVNTAVNVGNNATVAISDVSLKDSDITVASGATANLSNATVAVSGGAGHSSTLSGVTVGEGVSVNVGWGASMSFLQQETAVQLKDLFIGSGAAVNAYIGTPSVSEIIAAQGGQAGIEQSITVTGTLTAKENAKLNADLTLADGATIDISGSNGLQMGSSLTLSQGAVINLSENLLLSIKDMVRGERLVLFSGVDALTLDGGAYDSETTYAAERYFNL